MDELTYLADAAAWTAFERKVIGCDNWLDEPARYPCYVVLMKDGMENEYSLFFYAEDVAQMAAQMGLRG